MRKKIRVVDESSDIDPMQIAIEQMKRIFINFANSLSDEIVGLLNHSGISAPDGKGWSRKKFEHMLKEYRDDRLSILSSDYCGLNDGIVCSCCGEYVNKSDVFCNSCFNEEYERGRLHGADDRREKRGSMYCKNTYCGVLHKKMNLTSGVAA